MSLYGVTYERVQINGIERRNVNLLSTVVAQRFNSTYIPPYITLHCTYDFHHRQHVDVDELQP